MPKKKTKKKITRKKKTACGRGIVKAVKKIKKDCKKTFGIFSGQIRASRLAKAGLVLMIVAACYVGAQFNAGAAGELDVSAYITGADDNQTPNGEYEVRFAIYSSDRTEVDPYPSESDSSVWEETQTVKVRNGVLKAYLGETVPLPSSIDFKNSQYWLGVRIGQDGEMVPRKRIGAVPLAITSIRAKEADSVKGATTGTAAGNIPLISTGGKIDIAILPTGTSGNTLVLSNDPRLVSATGSTMTSSTVTSSTVDNSDIQDLTADASSLNFATNSSLSGNFDITVSKKTNPPSLRYNSSSGVWQFSNDGTTFVDFSTGAADLSSYLPLSGGTMTGSIVFAGSQTFGGATLTELSYLSGATSAIQTQLDAKAASTHAHAAGDITSGTLGVVRGGTGISNIAKGSIPYSDSADNLTALTGLAADNGENLRFNWNGGNPTLTWEAAAGGFTSFTAAGDSGGGRTISDGNTLTIAGGTNLTSVDSDTDTVTINLDGTLSGVTWNGNAIDISSYTNLGVGGTMLQLSGDTLSVKEGTLTNNKLCTYVSGTGLVCTTDPGGVGVSYWTQYGTDIANNNAGNVGIGTTNPTNGKLEVIGTVYASGFSLSGAAISADTAQAYLSSGLSTGLVKVTTGTGALTVITDSSTNWDAAYSALHSAVTLGTASGLSLATQQLSLGLASSGVTGALSGSDWNTFSGKQNALTNPVTGTGTTGYLTRWATASTVGSSVIYDDGTNVGIGTTAPSYNLQVAGTLGIGGTAYFGGNVGIGTTNPLHKLDINGNLGIVASGYLNFGSTDGTSGYGLFDNSGTLQYKNSGGSWTNFSSLPSGSSGQTLRYNSGWVANDNLYNDGTNVGIGTTSPTDKLDIFGGMKIGEGYAGIGTTAPANGMLVQGNVGIGTTSPGAYKLDVTGYANASSGLCIGGDCKTSWASGGIGSNYWQRNGTNIAPATIGDNVGIGTTAPGNKLSIYGSAADADLNFTDSNASAFTMGVDYSDAGKFKIANSSILGGGDILAITSAIAGTSYSNSGGTGNRTGTITASNSGIITFGTASNLIDGSFSNSTWFGNITVTGHWVKFDFGAGSSKVINEAKWYQGGSTATGVWKWQGSNNDADWTDIGGIFTLGGSTLQTMTTLSSNTTGYRYYRLLGFSGTSQSVNLQEIEFKIADYVGYNKIGIANSQPGARFDIKGGGTGTDFTFRTQDSTGASKFVIQDNGNVGIGTTDPGATLNLVGSFKFVDGNQGTSKVLTSDTNGVATWQAASGLSGGTINYIPIWTGATSQSSSVIYQTGGNVGIGATAPGSKLTVSGGVGIGTTAPGSLYLSTAAPDGGLIIEGNVGIGTTSPGAKLDVAGNINFTGKLLEDGNEVFSGIIAAFNGSCPTGWTEYTAARGRTVVGTPASGTNAGTVGTALTNLQSPTHTHTTPALPHSMSGTGGYGFAEGVLIYDHPASGTGATAGHLPYIQLTYCQKTAGSDIAEWIPASEDISEETIVSVDPNNREKVIASRREYDSTAIGIVSTQPGWLLGDKGEDQVQMALAGRVPTRVTLKNGEIKPGDPITTSSIPGVGMKATRAGPIVGKAMEAVNESSSLISCTDPATGQEEKCATALVFVNISWYDDSKNELTASGGGDTVFMGNVGIGTTAPTNLLDVAGGVKIGSGYAGIGTTAPVNGLLVQGNVGIGTSTPGYKLEVYTGSASGYVVTATGAWGNTSDARLKKNILSMDSALEKVMALNPVTYNVLGENDSDPAHMGFIAQEVEKISPDLVSAGPNGYKGISYALFTPMLARAIQEQQGEISEQGSRISNLDLKITENSLSVSELQTAVNEKLTLVSNSLNSLDSRTVANESQLSTLKSQISNAEIKLTESENNLATFETATNDTLSTMLETEKMLTERILDHEERLKALEDKMATVTISGGSIPSNILTTDISGNAKLAGIFEAKGIKTDGIVAGDLTIKNQNSDSPTIGKAMLKSGEKEIIVKTASVAENSQIFVTPKTTLKQSLAVTMIKPGENFKVEVEEPVSKDIEFSWWIVTEK